jgi:hypothetical protein
VAAEIDMSEIVTDKARHSRIRFMSLYLPDKQKGQQIFLDTLAVVDAFMCSWGNGSWIVGGDLNLELPHIHNLVGEQVSGKALCPKGQALLAWAHKWDLGWSSTWGSPECDYWTFRNKSQHQSRPEVLDYILCSPSLCIRCSVDYAIDFHCDHRLIRGGIAETRKIPMRRKTRAKFDNPTAIAHAESFFQASEQCHLPDSINEVQAFLKHIVSTCPRPPPKTRKPPIEVQNRFAALAEHEGDASEKLALARDAFRARRAWRDSCKAISSIEQLRNCVKKTKKNNKTTRVLECSAADGSVSKTADRAAWRSAASDFYAALYADPSVKHDTLDFAERGRVREEQLSRLRAIRQRCREQGAAGNKIDIPFWLTCEVKAKLSAKASTAPGVDGVGWDLLRLLPDRLVHHIHVLFRKRLLSCFDDHTEYVEDWHHILVRLIPKPGDISLLKNWRPISVSAVLQKWFCGILARLVDEHSLPLSPAATGFRAGRQTHDIIETVRHCLQKTALWGIRFCCLVVDIRKAFDNMSHATLEEAFKFFKTPDVLVHAAMCELTESYMNIHFQDTSCATPLLLSRGGRQGSSDTPNWWNRYFDMAWQKAVVRWQALALGFWLRSDGAGDHIIEGAYWADNVYIFGNCQETCFRMFRILSEEIMACGLSWKEGELELLDNQGTAGPILCDTCFGELEIRCVDELNVLGVLLDRKGTTSTSLSHRLRMAEGTWVMCKDYFCSRRVPLRERFIKFYEVIGRCVLYGAGGWTLRQEQVEKLNRWEKWHILQILGRKQGEEEGGAEYHIRIDAIISKLRQTTGMAPLSCDAAFAYFGWAGHLARTDANLPVYKVFCWRDAEWFEWSRMQDHFPRMVQPGRPVRWEDSVCNILGSNWKHYCEDRTKWRAMKHKLGMEMWSKLGGKRTAAWTLTCSPLNHIAGRLSIFPERNTNLPILFLVDNMQVACQVNGVWPCDPGSTFRSLVDQSRWMLSALQHRSRICPWPSHSHLLLYRPRKENAAADAAAWLARTQGAFAWEERCWNTAASKVLVSSDASFDATCTAEHNAGLGCVVSLYSCGAPRMVVASGTPCRSETNVHAEFEALLFNLSRMIRVLHRLGESTGVAT